MTSLKVCGLLVAAAVSIGACGGSEADDAEESSAASSSSTAFHVGSYDLFELLEHGALTAGSGSAQRITIHEVRETSIVLSVLSENAYTGVVTHLEKVTAEIDPPAAGSDAAWATHAKGDCTILVRSRGTGAGLRLSLDAIGSVRSDDPFVCPEIGSTSAFYPSDAIVGQEGRFMNREKKAMVAVANVNRPRSALTEFSAFDLLRGDLEVQISGGGQHFLALPVGRGAAHTSYRGDDCQIDITFAKAETKVTAKGACTSAFGSAWDPSGAYARF